MKKSIAIITAAAILFCFALIYYENSYRSKKLLFTSAVLTENEEKRFDGAETFDEISHKYADVIKIIKDGFDNHIDSINISSYNITHDDLEMVITYIINSGYFYISNSYSYKSDGKYIISLSPEYLMNSDDVKKYNEEIESVIDDIAGRASSFKNRIEKLIFIHNYLVENIEYSETESSDINNIYGALILKKTMCVGYSQAFCRIAERAGFKTYIVTSETLMHAWNMVNLNGEYFFVDCTWDDPVFDEINLSNDPVSGYGCYEYFMCSEEFFLKNKHDASDYIVNGENVMGIVSSKIYDNFFWRNSEALMKYSNGGWYHDYGYQSDEVRFPSDVKFSIDKFTFTDNKNYNQATLRTIKACWQYGNQFYIEYSPTIQNIDNFIYYFKPDGIYRLDEDGRFNGKGDLLIFENPTNKNIYDFDIDTENGKFTVVYGNSYDYTESNSLKKEYNISDYFCKAQKHQYVLAEEDGTGDVLYICTACKNTMKEIA